MNNNNLNVALGVLVGANQHGGSGSCSGSASVGGSSPDNHRFAVAGDFCGSGSVSCGTTDMDPLDDLEPEQRDRSNTWPLQRPSGDLGHLMSPMIHEGIPEEDDHDQADVIDHGDFGCNESDFSGDGSCNNPGNNGGLTDPSCFGGFFGSASAVRNLTDDGSMMTGVNGGPFCGTMEDDRQHQQQHQQQPAKKNTARRNAWGNFSYAELITQAIRGSNEQRLTLAQIYEWFGHNVAYFRAKGDSNSSAGWKNSIRHNLSLHDRFVRLQNEGAGKSSWWIVNPDPKPGKSSRRRTTNTEQSQPLKIVEKKRGRSKKKLQHSAAASTISLNDPCGSSSTNVAGLSATRTPPQPSEFEPTPTAALGFSAMSQQQPGALGPMSRPRCNSSTSTILGHLRVVSPPSMDDCGGGRGSACPSAAGPSNFDAAAHSAALMGGPLGHLTRLDFRPRSDSNLSNYSVVSCGSKPNTQGGRLTPSLEESLFDEWDLSNQHALQGGLLSFNPSDSNVTYPDLVDSLSQSMSLGGGALTGTSPPDRRPVRTHQGHLIDVCSPTPYRVNAAHSSDGGGTKRPSPDADRCMQPQQSMLAAKLSPRHRTPVPPPTSIGGARQQQSRVGAQQPVMNSQLAACSASGLGNVKLETPVHGGLGTVRTDPNLLAYGGFEVTELNSDPSNIAEPPTYQELYPATVNSLRASSSQPMLADALQHKTAAGHNLQFAMGGAIPHRTLIARLSGSGGGSLIASSNRGPSYRNPTIASAHDQIDVKSLLLRSNNHQQHTNGLHHYATSNFNHHNQHHQHSELYHHQQQLPMELSEIHYDRTFESDIQCDIGQIFRHEMRVAGNLDFTNRNVDFTNI